MNGTEFALADRVGAIRAMAEKYDLEGGAWIGDWNGDGWEKQAHLRMWAYETRNK